METNDTFERTNYDFSDEPIVETPANYAGFFMRFVALLVDGFILNVVSYVLILPLMGGFDMSMFLEDPDMMSEAEAMEYGMQMFSIFGKLAVLSLIASWLYYALMESSSKQGTLGKMALGIKVTDMDGNRISFGRATGRYFSKIISAIPLYIGFIMAAFTDNKQALHDKIASTLVLKNK